MSVWMSAWKNQHNVLYHVSTASWLSVCLAEKRAVPQIMDCYVKMSKQRKICIMSSLQQQSGWRMTTSFSEVIHRNGLLIRPIRMLVTEKFTRSRGAPSPWDFVEKTIKASALKQTDSPRSLFVDRRPNLTSSVNSAPTFLVRCVS